MVIVGESTEKVLLYAFELLDDCAHLTALAGPDEFSAIAFEIQSLEVFLS